MQDGEEIAALECVGVGWGGKTGKTLQWFHASIPAESAETPASPTKMESAGGSRQTCVSTLCSRSPPTLPPSLFPFILRLLSAPELQQVDVCNYQTAYNCFYLIHADKIKLKAALALKGFPQAF